MKKALLFLSLWLGQVWSLSVSMPETISQPGYNYWPRVAMNGKGDALALWVAADEDKEEETLFAATLKEKKWSSAQISKPSKDVFSHQLWIDAEGNSFALWEVENLDSEGNKLEFYQFAKKEKNKDWSPAVNVLNPEEDLKYPRFTLDANGNPLFIGHATGQESDLKSNNTKTTVYDHQTGQKKHVELAKDAGFTSKESLFTNEQGKVFAFWEEYHSKYKDNRRYPSEWVMKGAWFQDQDNCPKPVLISSIDDDKGSLLDVNGSINSKGDVAILWEKSDSKDMKRLQVVTSSDQQWSEPLDLASSKNYFRNFEVVMNDQGDIVVGWTATEKGKNVAYVAQKSKGGPWSAPLALSDISRKTYGFKVALDNDGNILAILLVKEGKRLSLQTTYQPKGQAWSSLVSLSNKDSDCDGVKICADETGHFVVLWEEAQKKRSSIHGATLSAKTQQWSYAVLSPEGLDCRSFDFVLNNKGEGVVVWKIVADEEEASIQAAELKIN